MKWLYAILLVALCAPLLPAQPGKQVFMQTRMRNVAGVVGDRGGGVFAFSTVVRREGHRFLFNDFLPGRVLFTGYEYLSEEIDMVIDGENDRLHILFEDESEGMLPLSQVQAIEVYRGEGDTVEYVVQDLSRVTTDASKGRRFYERLYGGEDFVVLHHERKYLRKEEYMENVGIVRRPDEYKILHSYFVVHKGDVVKIKRNRRNIAKALPAYKKEIKQIIKETNNKLKDKEDLRKLFADLDEQI